MSSITHDLGSSSDGLTDRLAKLGPAALLTLVCVAQFMVMLDVSIVNVALPSIRRELGFSQVGLQWVVNAYALAFAGCLLLGGRLADLVGRRRMFLIGVGCFTACSFLCGIAQGQGMLGAARAAQGLSAALLSPVTLTILTTSFPEGPQRARAMGAWSAVASGGAVAGALIGGVLTQWITWRWIFFINVPIGILALVSARSLLPADRTSFDRPGLDLLGAILVTTSLGLISFGIVESSTHGWTSPLTLFPLTGGVVKLAAFVVFEAKFARQPLLRLELFKNRSVTGANATGFLISSTMFALWFFLTLYLQNVLSYDPLKAGLAFVPSGLAIVAGTQISSRLISRTGPRPLLLVGPLVTAAGLLWFSRLPSSGGYLAHVLGPSIVTMVGLGISFVPLTMAGVSGVPRGQAGLASGLFNTSRQVGGSLGLAVLATLAASRTKALLAGSHPTHAAVLGALTSGYTRGFAIGAVVVLAAGVVAVALVPGKASSKRRWRHAISAALGQPWHTGQEVEAR
jgi:EmrB/QacA subfamily drug resistance transporter